MIRFWYQFLYQFYDSLQRCFRKPTLAYKTLSGVATATTNMSSRNVLYRHCSRMAT
jgi:hypothetical protein